MARVRVGNTRGEAREDKQGGKESQSQSELSEPSTTAAWTLARGPHHTHRSYPIRPNPGPTTPYTHPNPSKLPNAPNRRALKPRPIVPSPPHRITSARSNGIFVSSLKTEDKNPMSCGYCDTRRKRKDNRARSKGISIRCGAKCGIFR